MTLDDYCAEIKNYFIVNYDKDIYVDTFTISGSKITLDFLDTNQYFRIVGSKFNDGVYKYDNRLTLIDETFDGAIWAMSVPPSFISLITEVNEYMTNNPNATSLQSETFGGYSYTRTQNYSKSKSLFDYLPTSLSDRFNRCRKLRVI